MTARLAALGLVLAALAAACNSGASPPRTTGTTAPPRVTTTETVVTETEVETQMTTVTHPPATTSESVLPPDAQLLESKPSLAATRLKVRLDCVEGHGVAHLGWTPAATPGEAQRLGMTILPDVTDPRDFDLLQPLPSSASTFTWAPLQGQAIHTWMVLTRHPDGWAPSARMSFTGPSCTADFNSP